MVIIKLLIHVLFFFLVNSLHQVLGQYSQLNTTSSWLKNHTKSLTLPLDKPPKPPICKIIPCKRSGPPTARKRCCRNQCVDLLSDPNHCRFCFKRCRFALSCCGGNCVDTNNDPSNCGQCGNECEPGAPCEFGMCGYAAPSSQPGKRRRHPKRPRPPPSPKSDGELHDDRDDDE
ncbi:BnaC06g03870D [Brassica napus]|uniref:Uncharacterized protein n=3 Tax=Brassica TaxID=3705 RepID=A0A0D3CPT8_BRAOL|nr:PREDICTED: stigma-specific STIG1-like protein 4 [Brassica oleracea var. oleracea]KAF3520305.1 hypothetical protein DY000_02059159 [Brassica cretica]CAF2055084.1 unnamed protein product [Brassica napus]CDY37112.1 BnaC06g03870D [Brassica napus]